MISFGIGSFFALFVVVGDGHLPAA